MKLFFYSNWEKCVQKKKARGNYRLSTKCDYLTANIFISPWNAPNFQHILSVCCTTDEGKTCGQYVFFFLENYFLFISNFFYSFHTFVCTYMLCMCESLLSSVIFICCCYCRLSFVYSFSSLPLCVLVAFISRFRLVHFSFCYMKFITYFLYPCLCVWSIYMCVHMCVCGNDVYKRKSMN